MPRAAPGVLARGASRRIIPGETGVPVQDLVRCMEGLSLRQCCSLGIQPGLQNKPRNECRILHSSVLQVDHGRLGEKVSKVGDCRPPPPGNPRLPLAWQKITPPSKGAGTDARFQPEHPVFISRYPLMGKDIQSFSHRNSFKTRNISSNLKELNPSQYFKKSHSYFSCAVKYTVLEFVNSHYHLYGFRLVGPPSIAITNVLKT
jgi:hypothetical protein